jgi:hypothetical protein
MSKNTDARKRCATCRERKPITDFEIPRHRVCAKCRGRGYYEAVEIWVGDPSEDIPTDAGDWEAAEIWSGPLDAPRRAITATNKGFNKYQRERNRARSLARELRLDAIRDKNGEPPKVTPLDAPPKRCLHCKRTLARTLFPTPRARICTQCDGPPLFIQPSYLRPAS